MSGYIFAIRAGIDNRKKSLLSSNMSSRCPHNMVNFGSPAAEIDPVVWCTPANLNGFRVLAALLHGSQVVGVTQICGVDQRHHLCSAGRSLRWALAHISTSFFLSSPNLSRRRLDVYHTSTHGVALARISHAGLKRGARGSLKIQDAKKSQKIAIWAPSHNFVGLYLRN